MARGGGGVRLAGRIHRLVRSILLPEAFDRRNGESMQEVFEDALASADGFVERLVWWGREIADLLATGRRLRAEARRHGAEFVARRRDSRTGAGMMTGLRDDLRYAVRSLVRRPAFTLFVLVTVALGVGATTAIYSTVEGVLLRPVPYPGAERMVSMMRPIGNSGGMRTPAPGQVEAWSAWDDVFEGVELMTRRTMTLGGEAEPTEIQAGLIRPSFHDFAEREPIVGRRFTDEEPATDARVVLLGHGFWERRFAGSTDALGQSIQLDGEPWTVVGVMPPRTPVLAFGAREVDLWRPLTPEVAARGVIPTGRLREGVTLKALNERLAVPMEITQQVGPPGPVEATGVARSLVDTIGSRMQDTIRVLMVAVLALLLIACVNVSNLLLSRANQRRRETAVRAALGGGRVRLARQMLAEGLLLGVAGGLLGIGLAWGGLVGILSLRPAALGALDAVAVNGRVLTFALSVSVAASLLFSLVPVWQATGRSALDALRGGARTEGGGTIGARVRWVLVSTEVALSFALVAGATLVLGSLARLQSSDPGFAAGEVVSIDVHLPSWRYASGEDAAPVFDRIEERLAGLPGVRSAARALGKPGSAGVTFGKVEAEGHEATEETHVLHGPPVGMGYFATMGQELRGREFEPDELQGVRSSVILAEGTARRFFGTVDVVGRRIRIGGGDEWQTVIGVTPDVAMTGLSAAERPMQMYYPYRAMYGIEATFFVRAATGVDPAALFAGVREITREEAPQARLEDLGLMSDHLGRTLARERFTSTLLGAFTGLALLLAAIGLYGVVTQLVGQRTREIGIRMALGADRARIRTLVLRYGAAATTAGILAGLALAVAGLGFVSSRLFGVEGGGPVEYGVAALVLAAVAMTATWIPARRATRIDPVVAMRTE